jgi:hypothetical protein
MKTFLGMEVEQSGKTIKLSLDCYIQQVLVYIKKMLHSKKVQILPGVTLKQEDVPELLGQRKQKYYLSFVAKLQFAATWVPIDTAFTVSQLA